MATTELPINVEKENTPNPSARSSINIGNSSGFIFDVSLSTAIAADGKSEAKAPQPKGPLSPEMLDKMNRYWRAANYLCIGQIYLFENPLLRAAQGRTDQAAAARALGNFAGTKLHLHSSEPPHQRT